MIMFTKCREGMEKVLGSHWVTVTNDSGQVLLLLRSPLLAVFSVANVWANPAGNDVGVNSIKMIELS